MAVVKNMIQLPECITIEQRKEWSEVIWGFEIKNFYEVLDQSGKSLLHILETGNSGTRRAWKNHAIRPFEFQIHDPISKEHLLTMKAPVRLFWYSINILSPDSTPILSVTRKLSFLGRVFKLEGKINGSIKGFWFFWKYKIFLDTNNNCLMVRKWNGIFKVFLFGASKFKLQFYKNTTDYNKVLLLASAFLPEMLYHDTNN